MNLTETRRSFPTGRRLHFVLLLLILWDVIGLVAELSFGSFLVQVSDNEIEGALGSRVSLSGASLVPLAVYVFMLARGPIRHRNLIWVAVVEQGAAAFFAVFHIAAGDIEVTYAAIPLAVSIGLLVLVLMNMPRQHAVT
jgi:hypothetical protein